MKVIIDPQVHVDVTGIMQYYNEVAGPAVSSDFYLEFRSCIDRISDWPLRYAVYKDKYRRANLRRFPIHVLYRVVDEEVVRVLAVRHDMRHPDFGLIS